ncbi:threonine aldolase family protein [Parasphingorhabdus cellanae]|uniref:Aromatic amino acid beta-eliminating lyase/threonine aldolase domain-containing protein n=1 Tax=Parasphingorhabdus cellanae TaxID=2806553 RepID=A0ABX7T8U4_9SPHN|nr:beta-eliminating lyase-related protein [Parasphingorhabdus cellanae]QTD57320.1 hypothetical protein J4G78_07255 [Parasphingorhabdus cellanae]
MRSLIEYNINRLDTISDLMLGVYAVEKTRRNLLTGMAVCASGAANVGYTAGLSAPLGVGGKRDSEKARTSSQAITKEDLTIEHDLAFPFQHFEKSFSDRLPLIENYMRSAGLSEEYYCKGEAISQLESKVAALFGKPSAMWCPTGTLAQSIAIRIHGDRTERNILQMHPTSHLVLHEEDGYKHAHGFEPSIGGEWREPLKAESIDKSAACMIIEMPQRHSGGILPTWEELEALKSRSHALGVPLHMDGARIWSCRSFYNQRSFAEIADGFSSVYVSFYKDIGAFGGAALVGDKDFIETARVWRSRLGGVVSEHWPVVCDTLRLIDNKLVEIDGLVKMTRSYAAFVDQTSQYSVSPNPPQSNFFHVLLPVPAHVAEAAQIEAAKETGVWFTNVFWNYESESTCAMEVKFSETTAAMPRELLENAFSKFFAHI